MGIPCSYEQRKLVLDTCRLDTESIRIAGRGYVIFFGVIGCGFARRNAVSRAVHGGIKAMDNTCLRYLASDCSMAVLESTGLVNIGSASTSTYSKYMQYLCTKDYSRKSLLVKFRGIHVPSKRKCARATGRSRSWQRRPSGHKSIELTVDASKTH